MTKETKAFADLLLTIRALRGEKGCPWDQKQTPESLTKYIKEESKELIEAIDSESINDSRDELGDLLFLIILTTEIYCEKGLFNVEDVIKSINLKMIRRHPHVFAGKEAGDEEDLKRQWQKIKNQEIKEKNSLTP